MGVNQETIDGMSLERIENLIKKFKNKSFHFNPVKRVYIPKPGKKTMRPLGIPTFTDRLVQEAIRMILHSIYEPIFEKTNSNFGFRPHRSTHHAMYKIKTQGSGSTYAIEGDIKGAYDNVSHKILLDKLSLQIKDIQFLKLIKQGLEAGIVEEWKFKETILGTPQGGIASPILFNIYMHEFDRYVLTELQTEVDKYNIITNRTKKKPVSKQYRKLSSRVERARKRYIQVKTPIPVLS